MTLPQLKGVFTSCGINEDCPPWSVQAEEIIHDKNKNKLNTKCFHKNL